MKKDTDMRPVFYGKHPVELGDYYLQTNEIIKLYSKVRRWIQNRFPGGIIYGRPRLGKTRAIKYLKFYLKEEFGQELPIFTMLCSQHKIATENKFYTDLLKDVGHSFYAQGKAEIKKDRLIKFFIEKAQKSNLHKIILFIDEAQMLHAEDYDWLMDIYNQLDRYSITITIILVGQKELIDQKSALIKSNKMQIIGRFMVFEYKFSGIKTVDDIKTCLIGYDINSEYPEGSNWSFTRYFFPEAFYNGNRLENDAELIFNCFKKVLENANIKSNFEIPMQYFTLVINDCLTTVGANGKGLYWPNEASWDNAIDNSGYLESEIYNKMFKD
ncbi:ATP-binding protein [Intestinibacter sp.]